MKKLIYSLLSAALLTGCSSLDSDWWNGETEADAVNEPLVVNDVNIRNYRSPRQMSGHSQSPGYTPDVDAFGAIVPTDAQRLVNGDERYQASPLTKHIGAYVQGMTQDLIANMEYLTDKTPVGVTHFSLLDGDLQQTNMLGFQLAESFMHELHKFRIPVIDYKSTEYIRVTSGGDFFLSRDFLELKNRVPLEYVLTGTLTRHQGGYLVNARIIGLDSKAVVSTAQMLVPHYVVDALLPEEQGMMKDGVNIIQG